jgi:hypothetical protein
MNAGAVTEQTIVADVERWLHDCVLGLSLCPYARAPYRSGRVRFVVVQQHHALGKVLSGEIDMLQRSTAVQIETTLMIVASGLVRFLDFNDVIGDLEDGLVQTGLAQEFQLVGFHPGYLFAGEAEDDPGQLTNRAPYPVVQLLRADSVAQAANEDDPLAIPERNVALLRSLSEAQLRSLFPWVYPPD